MRICSLRIRNFRTIETLELALHPTYTAICGPNDSGKTNVIRAIRVLMAEDGGRNPFSDSADITPKDDYPKWKGEPAQQDRLSVTAVLEIGKLRDAGLYQSLIKQLSVESPSDHLELEVTVSHSAEMTTRRAEVIVGDKKYDGLEAQEAVNRIQSGKSVVFHNSTQIPPRIFFNAGTSVEVLRELSFENEQLLSRLKKSVNKGLAKVAKGRQQEFEQLLGKLERKYKVGLSLPTFEFTNLPVSITLGEVGYQVRLDEWGSGTRNRTQILLALFTAKKISESEESASKTTPIIIIEEPECFLHPSAQAEFGKVIRDLAEEFSVQVIMTTHSPYMLSLTSPESNILLRRRAYRDQVRETEHIDTSGENWMQPFAEALGLESEEFEPWKKLFVAGTEAVLLVEGEVDKAYFELLRQSCHGTDRLDFAGEIVPYEGTGALTNQTLLRFIQNRYRNVFITVDLDSIQQVEKNLGRLGLHEGKDYVAVGVDAAGRKNIEGLLPDAVKTKVRERVPALVDAASHATGEEQKSARNQLKQLYLAEFRDTCQPGPEFFGGFYPIVAKINQRLRGA
jgi:predicted ATP-dependent endonuclease of OLD family